MLIVETVSAQSDSLSLSMGNSCLLSASTIHCKLPDLYINNGPISSSLLPAMSLPQNPRSTSSCFLPRPPFNGRFRLRRRSTSIHHHHQHPQPNRRFNVRSSTEKSSTSASETSSNTKLIVIASLTTVTLSVANRVLYKLALVPMKQYPFFLAQLTTFGYVAVYFSILYIRHHAGIVTDEMMATPKSPFIIIGVLEALGVAAGMSSAAMLPGPALPILHQTFLVWQLAFSFLLLGRKYSWNRIAGCLLVLAGVVLAVASGSDTNQMLSGVGLVWPLLMIASSAFQAGASILKESVFTEAANRLKGKRLDLFVVNSFGSGFQALFVLLFLPFLSNLKGIPFSQLPSYLRSGVGCFINMGAHTADCDGAPLLPLLYIVTNIAFNISVLNLLKISSAVVSSLVTMAAVPISVYVLSLPLPYLPEGASLSSFFVVGTIVLVIGLFLYHIPQPLKQDPDFD